MSREQELETQVRHVRETNAMLWHKLHEMEDLAKELEEKVAKLEAELDRAWGVGP